MNIDDARRELAELEKRWFETRELCKRLEAAGDPACYAAYHECSRIDKQIFRVLDIIKQYENFCR